MAICSPSTCGAASASAPAGVVARVGATGNANNTPHLYLEVLGEGVRIDPARVFTLQAG
jgi:hypothetical protein